jgi:hypothetical protein
MPKLPQIIASKFASQNGIIEIRLRVAKICFVFCVLLFCVSYFFIGGGFYDVFFLQMLPYSYLALIASAVFMIHLMLLHRYTRLQDTVASI